MTMGRDGYLYYVDLVGSRVGRLLFTPAGAPLLAEPVAGDFDGDGVATGNDFLAWQRGLGTTVGATLADGDADGDGAVTGSDLAVWKSSFSQSEEPAAAVSTASGLDAVAYWLAFDDKDVEAEAKSAALIEEPLIENSVSGRTSSANSIAAHSLAYEATKSSAPQETDDVFAAWDDEAFSWDLPL
jgi:hypothetical protein